MNIAFIHVWSSRRATKVAQHEARKILDASGMSQRLAIRGLFLLKPRLHDTTCRCRLNVCMHGTTGLTVWQPVGQQLVSCIQTSNRLSNRSYNWMFNCNWLYRVNKHPTGCTTGCIM